MREPPYIEVTIFNPQTGSYNSVRALVDTGANRTFISEKTAQALGLQTIGIAKVETANGIIDINEYVVNIKVEDKLFRNKMVLGLRFPEATLVGWDILTEKPLILTNILFGQIGHLLEAVPDIKKSTALIIGQDTTEIYRLHAIQKRLRHHGYTGIIIKEISDIEIQSVEEKVNMLASLCRFIICENSVPSGHIDELKICAFNRYVTAILQEKGLGATMMQADYPLDYSFMKMFTYPSISDMDPVIDNAIKWAELKVEERRKYFNNLYGWR